MAAEKVDTVTRVQLPEAGDGVELYLTVGDFRRLHNLLGKGYVGLLDEGLSAADFEVMDTFLSAAAKKRGKPFPLKVDSLDMRLEAIRDRLRDAYAYSMAGIPYREYVKKVVRDSRVLAEEMAGEDGKKDTPFPAAGSENSTIERTEPDSSQEKLTL